MIDWNEELPEGLAAVAMMFSLLALFALLLALGIAE